MHTHEDGTIHQDDEDEDLEMDSERAPAVSREEYLAAHPGFARIAALFEYLDPTDAERDSGDIVEVRTPQGGYAFSRTRLEERRGEVRDLIAKYIVGDAWYTTGLDWLDLSELPKLDEVLPTPAAGDALIGLAVGLGFAKVTFNHEDEALLRDNPLAALMGVELRANVVWNLTGNTEAASA